MNLRCSLLSSVSRLSVLAVVGGALAGPASAQDRLKFDEPLAALPAVSALNAKIGGFGGKFDDLSAGGAFFGLSMPLGHSYGLQLDGMAGSADGDAFYGFGGHLFWRDPSRGLIGLYASHVSWDADAYIGHSLAGSANLGKVGVETHIYLDRITLEGITAYQFGTKNGLAGKSTIALYLTDDLRIHAGASSYAGGWPHVFAGAEWAPMPGRGLSLFTELGYDDDLGGRALGGLKIYLSPENKSLMRRHREDDPEVGLPDDLFMTIKGPCPVGQSLHQGICDGNT